MSSGGFIFHARCHLMLYTWGQVKQAKDVFRDSCPKYAQSGTQDGQQKIVLSMTNERESTHNSAIKHIYQQSSLKGAGFQESSSSSSIHLNEENLFHRNKAICDQGIIQE